MTSCLVFVAHDAKRPSLAKLPGFKNAKLASYKFFLKTFLKTTQSGFGNSFIEYNITKQKIFLKILASKITLGDFLAKKSLIVSIPIASTIKENIILMS